MHHAALGCLADQLIARRLDLSGGFVDDLALCRHWQRDAQVFLQAFEPIPGKPAAVAQQGDHARRRLIILFLARFFRRRGGKHIPAEVAPQLLQLIHRRGDGSLPFDPHQHARVALRIDFTPLTIGTLVTRLQRCVRNLDFARAPIAAALLRPCPGALLFGALPGGLCFFSSVSMPACFSTVFRLFRAGVTQQTA